ncbi:MAG: alpha/beta hydrolase, partial [Alphaproteobacteria bacterium]|nr:alpha/beta hydrolase [Alphaproteobacteria bacterium]
VAIKLMEMGFNVFVLQYSVAPAKHPVHLLEMASLFNLLNNNQEKFNIDVNRIGVMGFSAGGHICALYSNLYQCKEIKKHFEKLYKPYATILAYPVISAEKDVWHEKSIINFLGHTPSQEEINCISAEKLVNANTPPTFIWHTAGDTMVSPLNSIKYAEALMKHNISTYLMIYPFGNHGMITADRETIAEISEKEDLISDWINQLKKWIDLTFFEK